MNAEILVHVKAIYEHWVEVTRQLREVDTHAASVLTVATILVELAAQPSEGEAVPLRVNIKPPQITVNGREWDLSEWKPQIETTVQSAT